MWPCSKYILCTYSFFRYCIYFFSSNCTLLENFSSYCLLLACALLFNETLSGFYCIIYNNFINFMHYIFFIFWNKIQDY